jgi:hypothetical protein
VHSREIQLHPGEISLECAKPRNHLVKLLIMLILLAADRSQHVQDQVPNSLPRGTWQFVRGGYLVLNN